MIFMKKPLSSLLLASLLWSGESDKNQLLSPSETLKIIELIKKYCYVLGEAAGKIGVYQHPYILINAKAK